MGRKKKEIVTNGTTIQDAAKYARLAGKNGQTSAFPRLEEFTVKGAVAASFELVEGVEKTTYRRATDFVVKWSGTQPELLEAFQIESAEHESIFTSMLGLGSLDVKFAVSLALGPAKDDEEGSDTLSYKTTILKALAASESDVIERLRGIIVSYFAAMHDYTAMLNAKAEIESRKPELPKTPEPVKIENEPILCPKREIN